MQEFVKSILNYYANFTETRFSSKSTLNYRWTSDPNLTLDISFFPEFKALWLDKLCNNDATNIDISPSQFKISLSPDDFKGKVQYLTVNELNLESLKNFIL